jgi:FemAB-related protein (PEP-CTERM system-associated)
MTDPAAHPARIEECDAPPPDWDAFIRGCPDATHAHLAAWGDVFREVFGHATRYWVVRDLGGTLVAVLPVTLVRSPLFGRHAVSVPFLNRGGPVGRAEALAPLVDAAVRSLGAEGYPAVQLRCRRPVDLPYPARSEKVTVTLPLLASAEAQFAAFAGKLRSQIRRADKEGATVRHGMEALAGFHAVFSEHMRDLGTPAMPHRFFDAVARAFAADVRLITVEYEGRAVAGGFGFRWRDEFEITWAASLRRSQRMAPNMRLYWAFMSQCIREGVTTFDFGRTTPDSGPHRFKRQWSEHEDPLPWIEAGQGDAVTRPKKEAGHFRLAARLWRRLPLAVATPLGARIVRGIP